VKGVHLPLTGLGVLGASATVADIAAGVHDIGRFEFDGTR
jgi:hypothetical protein